MVALTFSSCGDRPKPEIKFNEKNSGGPLGDSVDAQKMRYADLKMDTTVLMEMNSWPSLTALNNTILEMKNADTVYSSYGDQLKQELSAMEQSIPSRLNNEKIKGRLNIMKKQMNDLQRTISKDSTDREAVASSAQQFLHGYKDFSASVRETLMTAGQKPVMPKGQ